MTNSKHIIKINYTCRWCRQHRSVTVYAEDYAKWQGGMVAHQAFPRLTASQREEIVSSFCPKCQDYIFGKPTSKYSFGEADYEF